MNAEVDIQRNLQIPKITLTEADQALHGTIGTITISARMTSIDPAQYGLLQEALNDVREAKAEVDASLAAVNASEAAAMESELAALSAETGAEAAHAAAAQTLLQTQQVLAETVRDTGDQSIAGNKTFRTLTIEDGGALRIDGTLTANEDDIFTNKLLAYSSTAQGDFGSRSNVGDLVHRGYVDESFLAINGGAVVLDGGSGENALAVYGGTNEGGSVRLHERRGFTGNNYVGIDGPNSMGVSYTLVMPSAPPAANQYLGFSYNSSGRYGMNWFDLTDDGGAVASKNYVDSGFLPLTGGTLTNNLTAYKLISTNSIVIDNPTGNPAQFLQHDGVNSLGMLGFTTYSLLRRYTAAGASASELRLYDDYIQSTVEARAPATTGSSNNLALTTKNYVDDELALKFDKTGGSVSGSIEAIDQAVLYSSVGDGNTSLLLRRDSSAPAHREFSLYAASNYGIVRRRNDAGEVANELLMRDTYSEFSQPVRCERLTISADLEQVLTTKSYVDGNFLPLAGGTLTDNLTIQRNDRVFVVLDSAANQDANIDFKETGISNFIIQTADNVATLRKRAGSGSQAEINLYATGVIRSSVEHQGVATTSSSDDLAFTTKGYVDDNFVGLTNAQTITGNKAISVLTIADGGALRVDGTLTSNENSIFTNKPLAYSAATQSDFDARSNAGDLAPRGYVNSQVDALSGYVHYMTGRWYFYHDNGLPWMTPFHLMYGPTYYQWNRQVGTGVDPNSPDSNTYRGLFVPAGTTIKKINFNLTPTKTTPTVVNYELVAYYRTDPLFGSGEEFGTVDTVVEVAREAQLLPTDHANTATRSVTVDINYTAADDGEFLFFLRPIGTAGTTGIDYVYSTVAIQLK